MQDTRFYSQMRHPARYFPGGWSGCVGKSVIPVGFCSSAPFGSIHWSKILFRFTTCGERRVALCGGGADHLMAN